MKIISIIIPSLHTKNSARRHTIPMKLLWKLADMLTMFGKSWRSIVPLAFCSMRIFVIPRVRSVVCYQLCCTAISCMCTGIASIHISLYPYILTFEFMDLCLWVCLFVVLFLALLLRQVWPNYNQTCHSRSVWPQLMFRVVFIFAVGLVE